MKFSVVALVLCLGFSMSGTARAADKTVRFSPALNFLNPPAAMADSCKDGTHETECRPHDASRKCCVGVCRLDEDSGQHYCDTNGGVQ